MEVKLGLLYDKQHEDFDSMEFNFLISNLSEIEVFPERWIPASKNRQNHELVGTCQEL